MTITVLGMSNGIDCIDSSNTSLLVRTDCTSILVDVSSSPRQSLLKAGVDSLSLDAIVLTHGHVDHVYAFPSLVHSMWLQNRVKPLIVLGNELALNVCKNLFLFFKLDKKVKFEIDWKIADTNKIGNIKVSAFNLYHRPNMPVNGYTFEADEVKMSYFPDSVASLPVPDVSLGSDVIIHEAAGLDKDREIINDSHTTSLQAAKLAKHTKAHALYLVHLPEDIDLRNAMLNEAKTVFKETYLPIPGLVIRKEI